MSLSSVSAAGELGEVRAQRAAITGAAARPKCLLGAGRRSAYAQLAADDTYTRNPAGDLGNSCEVYEDAGGHRHSGGARPPRDDFLAARTPRRLDRHAFDSRAGGDAEIYLVSPDGGRAVPLTSEPSNDCVPSWSRDGRWIYFASDSSGEFQVWRMPASGGQAIQVTRRGGYGAFEAPDGRTVYYAKGYGYGKTSVWRVPVEGGEEVQVIDDVWSRHNFYVVDEGIYFIHSLDPEAGYPICFYRFSTGRVERVGLINQEIAIGLCVWPLSRPQWLLYAVHEESPGDLMLIENFR